jgi:hypothetical protein
MVNAILIYVVYYVIPQYYIDVKHGIGGKSPVGGQPPTYTGPIPKSCQVRVLSL